jgi:hypothetical protein
MLFFGVWKRHFEFIKIKILTYKELRLSLFQKNKIK